MQVISRSLNQTLKIGKKIAASLCTGDIICLFGELGSGKTALVKGIAQGLGINKEQVVSPSFVLLRAYAKAKLPLYHFDLYRLKAAQDIRGLGYEEYFYAQGVSVIEWADRLGYFLPQECLKIELFHKSKAQRLLKFSASGSRYRQLLKEIGSPRPSLKAQNKIGGRAG